MIRKHYVVYKDDDGSLQVSKEFENITEAKKYLQSVATSREPRLVKEVAEDSINWPEVVIKFRSRELRPSKYKGTTYKGSRVEAVTTVIPDLKTLYNKYGVDISLNNYPGTLIVRTREGDQLTDHLFDYAYDSGDEDMSADYFLCEIQDLDEMEVRK